MRFLEPKSAQRCPVFDRSPACSARKQKKKKAHSELETYHLGYKTKNNALVAAEMLNDRVAHFYEQHAIGLIRTLTDIGTEYCGSREQHEYRLYLAIEDLDHPKTKAKNLQTQWNMRSFPPKHSR